MNCPLPEPPQVDIYDYATVGWHGARAQHPTAEHMRAAGPAVVAPSTSSVQEPSAAAHMASIPTISSRGGQKRLTQSGADAGYAMHDVHDTLHDTRPIG